MLETNILGCRQGIPSPFSHLKAGSFGWRSHAALEGEPLRSQRNGCKSAIAEVTVKGHLRRQGVQCSIVGLGAVILLSGQQFCWMLLLGVLRCCSADSVKPSRDAYCCPLEGLGIVNICARKAADSNSAGRLCSCRNCYVNFFAEASTAARRGAPPCRTLLATLLT